MNNNLPTKELVIAIVERDDVVLMRQKPEGSSPYKETWYSFGCDRIPNQDDRTNIKNYLKDTIGIDVEVDNQSITPAFEIKEDHDGVEKNFIYINLISKLFNMYCSKYEENIIDFSFSVPEFFNTDKFRVNQGLIKNQTTIELINKHSKLEYLFKILLSNFQREQKKQVGIINEIALEHLNNLIRKIQIKIEEQLNYNTNIDRYNFKYQDLTNYPNIKWEEDHRGHVMTDMGSLFPDNNGDDDKKKLDKKK